jgi:metallo-beta-lactamase family protein
VQASIERIRAYSAHADRSDLLDFLRPAKATGARIFLVHGDEDAALSLADALHEEGHADVTVPEPYARYTLWPQGD